MDTETRQPADPAVVTRLCIEAGAPDLARHFIARNFSESQVAARLEEVADIRLAGAAAGRVCGAIDPALADRFIAAGASPQHAKRQLLAAIVADQGPEIRSHHGQASASGGVGGANFGWDKIVADLNARHERGGSGS